MSTLLMVLAFYMAAAFNMSCPLHSERYLRSKGKCTDYRNYTCLFDENLNTFIESCSVRFDFQRPGYRVTLRTNLHAGACPVNLYQPFTFFTNTSSNCELKRSFCSEEGQIVSRNGTTRTDRQCRCDYSLGYSYVHKPNNICSCLPSEEDCSCHREKCSKNNILSPDYQCIDQSTWSGKFLCSSISDLRFPKVTVSSNTKDLQREVVRMKRTTRLVIITIAILLLLTYLIMFTLLVTVLLSGKCCKHDKNQNSKKGLSSTAFSSPNASVDKSKFQTRPYRTDLQQVATSDENSDFEDFISALDISFPSSRSSLTQDGKIESPSILVPTLPETVSQTLVLPDPSDVGYAIKSINSKPVNRKKTADDIYAIQHEVFEKELIKQEKEIEVLNLKIEILKKK